MTTIMSTKGSKRSISLKLIETGLDKKKISDPYIEERYEISKNERRDIINQELMVLYGHSVDGYLPPLPAQTRPQTSLAKAWSCENQAIRQLANLKKRGPRSFALTGAIHDRVPSAYQETLRPHTAASALICDTLNKKYEEKSLEERPQTSGGKLEKVHQLQMESQRLRRLIPLDQTVSMMMKLKKFYFKPKKVDMAPLLDVTNLPNGGLRKPKPALPEDAEKKKKKEMRRAGSVNLSSKSQEADVQILRGRLDSLPSLIPSVIRIYLCSLDSDFYEERRILRERVYPELRTYFKKHNIDFQIVDFNLQNPNADNMDLRMSAIEKCHKESLGPSFVLLIGNRYGSVEIPRQISSELFVTLNDAAKNAKLEDNELFEEWFILEENVNPKVYILKDVSADPDLWEEKEPLLQILFKDSFNVAVSQENLTKDQKALFFTSNLDKEIKGGILDHPDPKTKTLCYIREIKNLSSVQSAADRYLDPSADPESGIFNVESKNKLAALKRSIIETLGEKNCNGFGIEVEDDYIDPENIPEHEEYLTGLCENFTNDIKRLVEEKRLMIQRKQVHYSTVIQDAVYHGQFAVDMLPGLCPRKEILEKVVEYVDTKGKEIHKPLVLYGEEGSGKTATMVLIADHLKSLHSASISVVFRHLGLTQGTLQIRDTLMTLYHHVALAYNMDIKDLDCATADLISREFNSLLESISKWHGEKQPLVILLDGVENLEEKNRAHTMFWLPRNLPKYVHLILSVDLNQRKLSSRIGSLVGARNSFIEIPAYSKEDAGHFIDKVLQSKQRCLTEEQKNILMTTFQNEGTPKTPLFMRLVISKAMLWSSHSDEDEISDMPEDLEQSVDNLLERVGTKHGVQVVKTVLCSILLLSNGLTEAEINDFLSCDNDIMEEFFQANDLGPLPDTIVFPLSVLSAVLADLGDFLTKKMVHGQIVYTVERTIFKKFICQRYVGEDHLMSQDDEWVTELRNRVFALFSQTEGIHKTYCSYYDDEEIEDASRQVIPQPLSTSNPRKILYLPEVLCLLDDVDALIEKIKEECLCNFKYLSLELQAIRPTNLSVYFSKFCHKDLEIEFMKTFFELTAKTLLAYPKSFAQQLIGCLPCIDKAKYPLIWSSLEQALDVVDNLEEPMLLPIMPCFASPLETCKQKIWTCTAMMKIEREKTLGVVKNTDGFIEIWDLASSEVVFSLGLKFDKVSPNVFCSSRFVFGQAGVKIRKWEIISGAMKRESDLIHHLGDSVSNIIILAYTDNFEVVAILCSDEDFNQTLSILGLEKDALICQLHNFDVKDEFYQDSATFTMFGKELVFINLRSETIEGDQTADVVKLNVFDVSANTYRYKVRCGIKALFKMVLFEKKEANPVAIICWKNCSIDFFDTRTGEFIYNVEAPLEPLEMKSVSFSEKFGFVFLATAERDSQNRHSSLYRIEFPPSTDELQVECILRQPHTPESDIKELDMFLILEEVNHVVLAASKAGQIYVWDLHLSKCIYSLEAHSRRMDHVTAAVAAYCFYTCSEREGVVKLWDIFHLLEKSRAVQDLEEESTAEQNEQGDKDNQIEFRNGPHFHRKTNVSTQKNLLTNMKGVSCIVILENSKYLIAGMEETIPVVWDMEKYDVAYKLEQHYTTDIATPWLDTAVNDSVVVGLTRNDWTTNVFPHMYLFQEWDTTTGRPIKSFDKDVFALSACVTADRSSLLLASVENYDPNGENPASLSFKLLNLTTHNFFIQVTYHSFVIPTEIQIVEDMSYAVTNNHPEEDTRLSDVYVFNLKTKELDPPTKGYDFKEGKKFKEYRATTTRVLKNGGAVSTGCHGDLQIWDILTCGYESNMYYTKVKNTQNPSLHNHRGEKIVDMVLSEDSSLLLCGAADHTASLWDLENEILLHTYGNHTAEVCKVAMSSDRSLILTASKDRYLNVWHFGKTDSPICRIYIHIAPHELKISKNKQMVIALGAQKNEESILMMFKLCNLS